MTLYNGMPAKVCTSIVDEDEVTLTPDDGLSAHVTIYNRDYSEVVVAETEMTWNAAKERWEYVWDTADDDASTYRVKARIEGVDGGSVWAYLKLKLSQDPVPV